MEPTGVAVSTSRENTASASIRIHTGTAVRREARGTVAK